MANLNEKLTKQLFSEVFSNGNLDALDTLMSESVVLHDDSIQTTKGLQHFKEFEKIYSTAFPDKKVTIDEIFCSGDNVIVRWTCKGTHKGQIFNQPPTNKPISVTGISIYTFKNGKIVEIHQHWNRLGLMEQVGIVQPAPKLHARAA